MYVYFVLIAYLKNCNFSKCHRLNHVVGVFTVQCTVDA